MIASLPEGWSTGRERQGWGWRVEAGRPCGLETAKGSAGFRWSLGRRSQFQQEQFQPFLNLDLHLLSDLPEDQDLALDLLGLLQLIRVT